MNHAICSDGSTTRKKKIPLIKLELRVARLGCQAIRHERKKVQALQAVSDNSRYSRSLLLPWIIKTQPLCFLHHHTFSPYRTKDHCVYRGKAVERKKKNAIAGALPISEGAEEEKSKLYVAAGSTRKKTQQAL